jgi:CRISPR-associated protein Cmr2
MFKNQTETYWNMQWSAVKLLGDEDRDEIKKLLPNSAYLNQTALLDIFNKIIENKKHYEKSGKGVLYSVTHQLVQGSLAATKLKQINRRPVQHGEKCQLCGEFEVLHHRPHIDGQSASVYSANIREFWNQLRARNDNEDNKELKENERLCTICLTKRMAYRVLKSDQQHVLHSTFNEADKFQSTTQMALYSWFVKNQIPEKDWNDIADSFHDQDTAEEEKSKIKGFKSALEVKDKYYAILLMDGDKMGKLINGETIASTWESVMHPEIVSRLNNTDFIEKYRKGWSNIYKDYPRRQVTPAIHAAISEALGDFSIYGAGQIVKEYNGRLIYAGGDDVCAILPMDNVFKAALDIRNYYVSSYKFIKDNQSFDIKQEWTPQAGKLSVQLGNGKDISISAGILICHHKENLNLMIARAHQLLNYNAKKIGERNACALELKKRSGGSRQIVARWEDSEYWKHFVALQTALRRSKDQQLSRSLLYRLSRFRDGLIAINSQNQPGKLKTFILNQMEKSEIKSKDNLNEIADNVAFLLKKELDRIKNDDLNQYNVNIIDGLTIAAFMAGKEIQ